ncbi:MAG: hypothetical protein JWO05_3855 [Gemmatimonadetes bacterium]|nr:hypothetical protein [Gemmatimonadota bacterium]
MSDALHLVTVWNPAYANNAMEEHLGVLLGLAADKKMKDDDVMVWWGKVKSPNRQAPQANVKEIEAIAASLLKQEVGEETHLYLTDYRSLYVGHVLTINFGDLRESELVRVPKYYAESGMKCDFWLGLTDLRRLVSDDLVGVIEELKQLRNTHYNDRPVSLYGGMVDLPLIVKRPDGRTFFSDEEMEQLTDGEIWAKHDAGLAGGIGETERSLRDDLFGEAAWHALDRTTRTFIATGERIYREHRADAGFDFAPVLGSFAKAIESQVALVLRAAVPMLSAEERRVKIEDRTVDLAEYRLMLGQLVYALGGEPKLGEGLRRVLKNGAWFTNQFPAIVDEFREVRNEGTHAKRVERAEATRWRNRLMGIGGEGVFQGLATVELNNPLRRRV